ncbi:MAG: hypothetical protein EU530_05270 [Promethearchaeota archaeon]|nr:MAG: hypothetical protein EU530_05270 [Candidatus Lokiarchaeota archaeon]
MKIWLNHTLACPDDGAYPLKLVIFTWENQEEDFSKLVKGYGAKSLFNFRNEESPLNFEILDSMPMNALIEKNISQLEEDSGIIHLVKDNEEGVIYDTCVIDPLPIDRYFQYYLEFLEEFSAIFDRSEYTSATESFKLIVEEIQSTIKEAYVKSKELPFGDLNEFLKPILQDLLFLNIFLTYMEIEEGVLVCSSCKTWFPVIKTIPRIYPKTMKREEMDLNFLTKWRKLYPDDVILD